MARGRLAAVGADVIRNAVRVAGAASRLRGCHDEDDTVSHNGRQRGLPRINQATMRAVGEQRDHFLS